MPLEEATDKSQQSRQLQTDAIIIMTIFYVSKPCYFGGFVFKSMQEVSTITSGP